MFEKAIRGRGETAPSGIKSCFTFITLLELDNLWRKDGAGRCLCSQLVRHSIKVITERNLNELTSRENKNRVVPKTISFQSVRKIPYSFIHKSHHSCIVAPLCIFNGGIRFHVFFRDFKRFMDGLKSKVEKEGLGWKGQNGN